MKRKDNPQFKNNREELKNISREVRKIGIENLDIQKLNEYKQIIINYDTDVFLNREAIQVIHALERQIKFKILNKRTENIDAKIQNLDDKIYKGRKNELSLENNSKLHFNGMRQDPEILRSTIVDDIDFIISEKIIKE